MKVLLCLLICRCFASLLAHSLSQPVWYAKFSEKGEAAHNDGEAFFDMPVNMSEAVNQGWVVAEINDHETVLCLPDDPRIGIIFGNDELVAGVDVGIPVTHLTSPYMVKDRPEFFNTTRLGQDVVVSRMYFVNPAELRKGGRQHQHGSVLSELWLKKGNGSVNIPTNQTVLEQTTLYTRESCIPAMGDSGIGRHRHVLFSTADIIAGVQSTQRQQVTAYNTRMKHLQEQKPSDIMEN